MPVLVTIEDNIDFVDIHEMHKVKKANLMCPQCLGDVGNCAQCKDAGTISVQYHPNTMFLSWISFAGLMSILRLDIESNTFTAFDVFSGEERLEPWKLESHKQTFAVQGENIYSDWLFGKTVVCQYVQTLHQIAVIATERGKDLIWGRAH